MITINCNLTEQKDIHILKREIKLHFFCFHYSVFWTWIIFVGITIQLFTVGHNYNSHVIAADRSYFQSKSTS